MRVLALLAQVAVVLAVVYLLYRGAVGLTRGRRPALPRGGRWQSYHYADDGHTVVAVARMTPSGEVLEEHVVARIPDTDEDWSQRFLRAREEAEERAFHLNADG